MRDDIKHEVLQRLGQFNFKEMKGWLRQGRCPSCGKKELYTNADKPWVVRCGRLNNCGFEANVKDIYPDLFDNWSNRYQEQQQSNPNAAADAYLILARGFSLDKIWGCYTQETYYDNRLKIGSATVRFKVADTWWERLIDQPSRFGKRKAGIQPGGHYAGRWWMPPALDLKTVDQIWLTEGIFDAIALWHHGIPAVSLISCSNYPEYELEQLAKERPNNRPTLVWALDGDQAGRSYTKRGVERAREAGWLCAAATIPQQGQRKQDWNDLHLLDRNSDDPDRQHLSQIGRKKYLHHGAILIARTATEKALLIYQNDNRRTEFDFEFGKRLYWFRMDVKAYQSALDRIGAENGDLADDEIRERALAEAGGIRQIANCYPLPLYFQENKLTDESWYYFRVEFPHSGAAVKNTFSASMVCTSSEFKKRLLGIAPGAVYTGSNMMLERMMERQLYNIKRVETVDYIGYSRDHGCYVLGDMAIKDGQIHRINGEDYFDIGTLSVKSLNKSVTLEINDNPAEYRTDWPDLIWRSSGAKGLAALTFWFGSLFAEQIRATQKSFPFLEVVGEAASGKSTLIEFLWKLFGRDDYEGFDPSKSSLAARARNFAQVSGLPVVLIEGDRERLGDEKSHVKSFDWDELKTAYNGRSVRARGMATSGNETYEPPFRGTVVISQNNEVAASDAVMQRIVHLYFDKSHHTPKTKEAADALNALKTKDVSGFILAATKREAQIMKTVEERTPYRERQLLQMPEMRSTRLAKNHAQMLALADALRLVVKLDDEQFQALTDQFMQMALERQQAINTDHPLVQEFWEAYEYLNGPDPVSPKLNHSRDPELIAINLNHFIQEAAEKKQQIPAIRDLKKVLKTSRRNKFVDRRVVNSLLRENASLASGSSTSVSCWVFEKGK
ncbi:bifunctional DNA primase/helicase [Alcaligenaceae bacterium SJ-26]|nr:bifunctional DNA primase/helicase [Alcaligenaceae bacterium SJ-26]